jgi:MFS family permease
MGAPRTRLSYGWLVVGCAVLYQAAVIGTAMYGTPLLLKQWSHTFGASRSQVILVPVLWQAGMAFAAPFAGRYLDVVPVRRLVLLGLGLFVAGLVLTARASALWQILILYPSVMAVGSLLAGQMSAQALAAKWFVERRGLALGVAALGTSVGGFIIPPLLAAAVARLGWRGALTSLGAGTAVLVAPLAWLVLRRSPPSSRPSGARGVPAHAWTAPEILRSRDFWIPSVSLSLLNVACIGVLTNLAAYAQDRGHSGAEAAATLSVLALAMVAGKLVMGALADRVSHRALYWFGGAVAIGGLLALMRSGGAGTLVAGGAAMGFSLGTSITLLAAIFAERFGASSFGRAIGIAYVVSNASALGPLVAAATYDRTGRYTGAFLAFVVVVALGMGLMAWHRVRSQPAGVVAQA